MQMQRPCDGYVDIYEGQMKMYETDNAAYIDSTHLYSPRNKLLLAPLETLQWWTLCYPAVEVKNAGYSDKISGVLREG